MADPVSRRAVVTGLAMLAAWPVVADAAPLTRAAQLVAAARRQVGVTLVYDPAYTRLGFPGGDVSRARGVCTDVVIRAYRDAFALDLQALVNADMRAAFASYPKRWGLRTTDRNIDHRRVPNLQAFLARAGASLPLNEWRAGDIFTGLVNGSLPHIGIISDRRGLRGLPLVIHNIGSGAREEAALFDHRLTGLFRWRV